MYTCNYCRKSFSQKSSIISHLKSHDQSSETIRKNSERSNKNKHTNDSFTRRKKNPSSSDLAASQPHEFENKDNFVNDSLINAVVIKEEKYSPDPQDLMFNQDIIENIFADVKEEIKKEVCKYYQYFVRKMH